MAHKKGQGSSRNGRDSPGQHRGVKIYGSEKVQAPATSSSASAARSSTPARTSASARTSRCSPLIDGTVKYTRTRGDRRVVSIVPEA